MATYQCERQDCDSEGFVRGLCRKHYRAAAYAGSELPPTRRVPAGPQECTIEGCEKVQRLRRGLCNGHYSRLRTYGDPLAGGPPIAPKGSGCTAQGYRWITVGGVQRAEHRVVMESILGRRLFKGENVHHINGVKHDNRPENLELWATSQPAGQRPQDLIPWAEEILARYSPESLAGGVPAGAPPSSQGVAA